MVTAAQRGRSARNKGKGGEREIVLLLRDVGFECSRNLDQTRDGGGDIVVGPYLFEVKRRAAAIGQNERAHWWVQATIAANDKGLQPILVYRSDRQDWWCRLPSSMTGNRIGCWVEIPFVFFLDFMRGGL